MNKETQAEPAEQPSADSLFLPNRLGQSENAGSGANMCEGRNKAIGEVPTTLRVPHSKLQGRIGS
jgi:hypothetical protein